MFRNAEKYYQKNRCKSIYRLVCRKLSGECKSDEGETVLSK